MPKDGLLEFSGVESHKAPKPLDQTGGTQCIKHSSNANAIPLGA